MQAKKDLISYWARHGIVKDKRIIDAFNAVARESFVLEKDHDLAYSDYPLPIIAGQTISQPTTIAIMLEALELKETDKVLEIGTGSGYNAVLIAKIVKKGFVYTTERIKELVDFAKANIKKADIKNAKIIYSDGSLGYETEAPFDKIISTAACPEIPKPWLEQLNNNGIIVAPVGDIYGQNVVKVKKEVKLGRISFSEQVLGDFMFVPMIGKHGFK